MQPSRKTGPGCAIVRRPHGEGRSNWLPVLEGPRPTAYSFRSLRSRSLSPCNGPSSDEGWRSRSSSLLTSSARAITQQPRPCVRRPSRVPMGDGFVGARPLLPPLGPVAPPGWLEFFRSADRSLGNLCRSRIRGQRSSHTPESTPPDPLVGHCLRRAHPPADRRTQPKSRKNDELERGDPLVVHSHAFRPLGAGSSSRGIPVS